MNLLNTIWQYIGSDDGKGMKHKIIRATKEEIITVTPNHLKQGETTYSWMGTPCDFRKQFSPTF